MAHITAMWCVLSFTIMFIVNGTEITPEQLSALTKLLERGWKVDYSSIMKLPADTAVAVRAVGNQTEMVIYFLIESDGYTHS